MATVNSLISFMYEIIQSSWLVASVIMKYFVAGIILRSVQLKDLTVEGLDQRIREYGRYVILGTGVLGMVVTLTGLDVQPLFLFPSQVLAVGVLGYLFWKY